MEAVIKHSIERATDEAVKLWSFASAQYPIQNGAIIQTRIEYMVVESASAFSFNARRAMEILPRDQEFKLLQPRYEWKPIGKGEVVANLWDALNRIIHSRKMEIGFEHFPDDSTMMAGAYVIPYLKAETDQRKTAFVDIFALSHCFIYAVRPALVASHEGGGTVH